MKGQKRYTATALDIIRTRKANKRDSSEINQKHLGKCIRLAMATRHPIHIPRSAVKLYFEKYPITDNRPCVQVLTCGTCKGYIGTVGMDDSEEYQCDDCGDNVNKREVALSLYN